MVMIRPLRALRPVNPKRRRTRSRRCYLSLDVASGDGQSLLLDPPPLPVESRGGEEEDDDDDDDWAGTGDDPLSFECKNEIDQYRDSVYEAASNNLHSFITEAALSEIDIDDNDDDDDDDDPGGDPKGRKRRGRNGPPCIIVYSVEMKASGGGDQSFCTRSQTGIACASSVQDYNEGQIKKHEQTKEDIRRESTEALRRTRAQTGSVLLVFRDIPLIEEVIIDWKSKHEPLYDLMTSDGIRHSMWQIDDRSVIRVIISLFETYVPCTYIADGHHRAAAASEYMQLELKSLHNPSISHHKEEPGRHDDDDHHHPHPAEFFLTTLFPASQLKTFGYHRLLRDLNGMTNDQFLLRLAHYYDIQLMEGTTYSLGRGNDKEEPINPGGLHGGGGSDDDNDAKEISLLENVATSTSVSLQGDAALSNLAIYLDSKWWLLRRKSSSRPLDDDHLDEDHLDDDAKIPDITFFTRHVLEHILEIDDVSGGSGRSSRIGYVQGDRNMEDLARLVDAEGDEWRVAVAFPPIVMTDILDLADRGDILPPKSTWFTPKLEGTGLVVRLMK